MDDSEWQGVRRSLLAHQDDDSNSLTTGIISAQEFSTIIVNAANSFVDILSGNPFRVSIDEAKPVISLLSVIIVLMAVGIVYFSRWDHKDHLQFVYVESNRRLLRERRKQRRELQKTAIKTNIFRSNVYKNEFASHWS